MKVICNSYHTFIACQKGHEKAQRILLQKYLFTRLRIRCTAAYQHWSVSHFVNRCRSDTTKPARGIRPTMDRSYRARAAGSDSVSYARRISRKSGPPPAGAASGWNRLAMARYAALISRAVAVSPTLSTWYRLAGALLLPAAVATCATTRRWAEMPRAGESEIPEKMTVPDMGEATK
ncbi:unnamed protein product [Musa banksii]